MASPYDATEPGYYDKVFRRRTGIQSKWYQTHRFLTIQPGRLPYDDRTFDVVTIIELVEHLHDAEALELLEEASRVTAPGGRLILTTPNYASIWPLLERLGALAQPYQRSGHGDWPAADPCSAKPSDERFLYVAPLTLGALRPAHVTDRL